MGLLDHINLPVFFISLALGIIFVAVFVPDKRVIYVYPTPENVDTIQYKDAADNCFEVKQIKKKCPTKSSEILTIPVQP